MLLRWAGVVVLYGASLAAHQLGHYRTSLAAGNVIAPFVIVYNVLVWRFIVAWTRRPPQNWRRAYRLLGNGQCTADLTVLVIGLHLTAGLKERRLDRDPDDRPSARPPETWIDVCAVDEIAESRARVATVSGERSRYSATATS